MHNADRKIQGDETVVRSRKEILPGIHRKDKFASLLGICAETDWRDKIVIPYLESQGIKYFNPQVADYKAEIHEPQEQVAKDNAHAQLVVVGDPDPAKQARCLVSIIEAIYLTLRGDNVVIARYPLIEGTSIEGQALTGIDLHSVKAAFQMLDEVIRKFKVPVYDTVEEAMLQIPAMMKRRRRKYSTRRATQTMTVPAVSADTQEITYYMGIDPYAIGTIIEAIKQAHALRYKGKQVVVYYHAALDLEQRLNYQFFCGLPFEGRRMKDWLRLFVPYVLRMLKEMGVVMRVYPSYPHSVSQAAAAAD